MFAMPLSFCVSVRLCISKGSAKLSACNNLYKGLEKDQIVSKIRLLTGPFLLRRFKSDLLKDLPEKQEQTVYCNFDDSQTELYEIMLDSIRHEMNRKVDRFEMKSNSIVLSGLLYLQEICCHPRLIPKEYNINGCLDKRKVTIYKLIVADTIEEKVNCCKIKRKNCLTKLLVVTIYLLILL